MKLFTKCPYCLKETSFRSFATDRGALAQEKGKQIQVSCNKCNSEFVCDVDNVYAKKSKLAAIVAILVIILGIPGAYFGLNSIIRNTGYVVFSTGMIAIPFLIYQIINAQDQKRVDIFNRFKTSK